MRSVLEASRETLKSIHINVSEEENYLRLWEMRFPSLRSLTLGKWHFDIEGAPDEFTKFTVAHGETLEEFQLAYGEYDDDAMTFVGSAFLHKDSLPRLKKFRGHTNAFKQIFETRMNCLQTSLET
jgi:hypothetical protein